MAVLGREHLDIWDLDIDSLTLSRSLNPLELFFDIPRAPVLSLKTPTHLVVQTSRIRHLRARIKYMNS